MLQSDYDCKTDKFVRNKIVATNVKELYSYELQQNFIFLLTCIIRAYTRNDHEKHLC